MHEWKDYFLDHRPRINLLIHRVAYPSDTSSMGAGPSHTPRSQVIHRMPNTLSSRRARRHRQPTERAKAIEPKASSGRSTINSITAFSAPQFPSLVPDIPSREPSPPTEIVSTNLRGNAFTQADTQFMIKYISWEMSQDSSLTKSKLSSMLEAKVRIFLFCLVTNLLLITHLKRHLTILPPHGGSICVDLTASSRR